MILFALIFAYMISVFGGYDVSNMNTYIIEESFESKEVKDYTNYIFQEQQYLSALLIDVRSSWEFELGSLENAINILYSDIWKYIEYFKNYDIIKLFCWIGNRSQIAYFVLSDIIEYIEVVNLGGIRDMTES